MSQMTIAGEGNDVRKAEADITRFFKVINKGENNAPPVMDCDIVNDMKLHDFDCPAPENQPKLRAVPSATQPADPQSRQRLFPLVTKAAKKEDSSNAPSISVSPTATASPAPAIAATKKKKPPAVRAPRGPPKARRKSNGSTSASPRKSKCGGGSTSSKRKIEDVVLVSYSDFLQHNAAAAERSAPAAVKEDVYQYDSDEEDADIGIVKIDYRRADKQRCITKYFSTAANGADAVGRKNARGGKTRKNSRGFAEVDAVVAAAPRGRGRPRGSPAKCNGSLQSGVKAKRGRKAAALVVVDGDDRSRSLGRTRGKVGRADEGEVETGGSVRRSSRVRSTTDLFDASVSVDDTSPRRKHHHHQRHRLEEEERVVPTTVAPTADGKNSGTLYQVAIINETGGKECIRLRLTRVGQQSEKAKFVMGTAQRLLNKAKLGTANKESTTSKKPVKRFTKISQAKKKSVTAASAAAAAAPKKILAPVFQNSVVKSNPESAVASPADQATVQRRQDFLMSGIPDKLRKQISITDEVLGSYTEYYSFPTISHVQQRGGASANDVSSEVWLLRPITFREVPQDCREPSPTGWTMTGLQYGTLTNCGDMEEASIVPDVRNDRTVLSCRDALSKVAVPDDMKLNVYEIFESFHQRRNKSCAADRLADNGKLDCNSVQESSDSECVVLPVNDKPEESNQDERSGGTKRGRKSKQRAANKRLKSDDENDCMVLEDVIRKDVRSEEASANDARVPDCLWTSVYRPRCAGEVLDNSTSLDALKTWLVQWKAINAAKAMGESKRRAKKKDDSGSESADDSNEEDSGLGNTVLLSGDSGCGKTATVYALAEELGYTVLEVNASSRRSGKQILAQLREATQSRHVKETSVAGFVKPPNAIASLFTKSADRKNIKDQSKVSGDERLERSSGSASVSRSLILFEDVDMVFSDDEGFWAAVNNFMASAKTPIVLTTCDSKFGEKGCIRGELKEIVFKHPDLRLQTLHLQLLCLAESQYVRQKDLASLVRHHRGNFRQTINTLQYMLKANTLQASLLEPYNAFDESLPITRSSSMDLPFVPLVDAFTRMTSKDARMNLFSLYEAFDADLVYANTLSLLQDHVTRTTHAFGGVSNAVALQPADGILRTFKRGDHEDERHRRHTIRTVADTFDDSSWLDVVGQTNRKWTTAACDLLPGLDDAATDEPSDHWDRTLQSEIRSWLQLGSYDRTFTALGRPGGRVDGLDNSSILGHSGSDMQSSERLGSSEMSAIGETRAAVTAALPPGVQLNRGAIGLDYLPCLRDVCRAERLKLNCGGSLKRGGRYSHYLCSSVLYLESAIVTQLCDELQGNS